MIWPRSEILRCHMEEGIFIWVFRRFQIWYLTWSFVIVRSMYVGGICRILWYPFTWKLFIFFWSVRFNCIVSNPYIILLLTMEWKIWTFHLIDVRVLFQNNLSLLHVRVQSVVGFMILCDCPRCLWAMFQNIQLTLFEGQACHLGIWWMMFWVESEVYAFV